MNIHHEHQTPPSRHARYGRNVLIGLLTALVVLVVEIWAYIQTGSLALLGDAGHMLVDVTGLVVAYTALRIASRPANPKATFGYQRAEVLAAAFNAVLLFVIVGLLIREGIARLYEPLESLDVRQVFIVGSIGLAANLVAAWFLHKDAGENINSKGALLNVLGDAMASVGVLVGTFLVYLTGDTRFDTYITFGIAAIIAYTAWGLFRQSMAILLERAPPDAHPLDVKRAMEGHRNVVNVHDLHVWTLTPGEHSLTAHVTIDRESIPRFHEVTKDIEELLKERFGVTHCTLQLEPVGHDEDSDQHDPLA